PAASVHPEPGSNSPLYKMFCSKSLALISKVLFEITLRREWENFSCSNTSKNAVRYIAIKNIFCFCRRVAPPGSVRCFRRAESGAKVKTFFETAKSFRKIFSENFSEPFSLLRRQGVVVKADAKVIQISETPKNPELFSKLFQNLSLLRSIAFSLEAGAKIRLAECYFQIFQRLFFDIFPHFFTPGYKSGS
ncbi:hypothetical protein, partial [uncultured Alistipes sp.]